MKTRDLVDYAALALLWGMSFAVVLEVVEAFGWAGATSFRALVAGVVLFGLAAVRRRRVRFGKPLAVIGATTVAMQQIGLTLAAPRIGTSMAAILVATIPLFSMLISHAWGIERISAQGVVGVVLGALGIVLLVGFPAEPITKTFVFGCAASLTGCVAAAYGSNYARRHLSGVPPSETTAGAFLLGGLMTLPLLLVEPVPGRPGPADFAYLLLLGAAMSALTYVLFFRLVADLGPTKAISSEFAVTVVAVIAGALLLHERLTAVQLAGAVVIIAGCGLILGLWGGGRERERERPAVGAGP